MRTFLVGGTVYAPDEVVEKGTVVVENGLRHATHVFNAMRSFHHREPGTVRGVLHFPEIVAQFIVDGQHLHPAAVEITPENEGD